MMTLSQWRRYSADTVVLTVSRVCKLVSGAVGNVGVRPFTVASFRI